jgi:mannose-1-phosphate guanylyltransferase
MVLLDEAAFLSCPAASVDRLLMEKDGARAVVGVDMGWRDLGSWPSLAAYMLGF